MPKATTITLIGIGQDLRGDSAAGMETVRLWQKTYPATAADPRVCVKQPGMPGLELIELLGDTDAVLLVDAVQSGAVPGTLHLVKLEQVDPSVKPGGSSHGWGAGETLALARELKYALPEQIFILGIEAASFAMDTPLSKAVSDSLAKAVEMIEDQIQWRFMM